MSIKRLPPEAVETFSILLHPKRVYSARKLHPISVPELTDFLLTEDGQELLAEDGSGLEVET